MTVRSTHARARTSYTIKHLCRFVHEDHNNTQVYLVPRLLIDDGHRRAPVVRDSVFLVDLEAPDNAACTHESIYIANAVT
jgi:hypothetical protein